MIEFFILIPIYIISALLLSKLFRKNSPEISTKKEIEKRDKVNNSTSICLLELRKIDEKIIERMRILDEEHKKEIEAYWEHVKENEIGTMWAMFNQPTYKRDVTLDMLKMQRDAYCETLGVLGKIY